MRKITIPENFKVVNALSPTTTNGALVGDYISVERGHRITIIVNLTQAATHATEIGINEAITTIGGTPAAMTATVPFWKNADVGTTDTLVKGTDAATFAATAGTNNQQFVIQIDPAALESTTKSIAVTTDASSESTNFASAVYLVDTYIKQATPPTMII